MESNIFIMKDASTKLGIGALIAVVFGMMVGSGIFNLPQNMAVNASPLGTLIAWIVTAIGMLTLVATFKILADRRPDLNAGIYQYAQRCFGNYAGFNIAWGYWLSAAFANVAYAVMLNDSFGAFFPSLMNHSWQTLIFGTVLIWGVYFLVSSGVRTAHIVNKLLAIIKIVSLVLVTILLLIAFKNNIFLLNWSELKINGDSLWSQVNNSMLVTLWCFIGIEGAVMLASEAKKPKDVGKATIIGFVISWTLYMLVSLLCYGAMSRAQLAGLENPSAAYALRVIYGDWAYWSVILSVILSILGVWLSWTIVAAELPFEAARVGFFPKQFLKRNEHGIPKLGILVSCIVMQSFMIIMLLSENVYLSILSITGMMVLPSYLSSGFYLWKESIKKNEIVFRNHSDRLKCMCISIGCVIFCIWMIYAGGWKLLVFTSWFYFIGTGFYLKTRAEHCAVKRSLNTNSKPANFCNYSNFSNADKLTLAVLIISSIISIFLFVTGYNPLN